MHYFQLLQALKFDNKKTKKNLRFMKKKFGTIDDQDIFWFLIIEPLGSKRK